MLPMPWQEVQICVHDVHETHIILQLVHTENCADLKNVEFAGSIINNFFLFISFKMQFSEEKKAPLDRVGRKVKKKYIYIFF